MDQRRVRRPSGGELRASEVRESLRRYGRNLGVPPADVDDLVSDTIELCLRKVGPDLDVPPAWFYLAFRRLAANRRRRLAAERDALERMRHVARRPAWGGAPPVERLEVLTPKLREAIHLVYDEDLTLAEAARVAGTSTSAMAVRVHRARQILRQAGSR